MRQAAPRLTGRFEDVWKRSTVAEGVDGPGGLWTDSEVAEKPLVT